MMMTILGFPGQMKYDDVKLLIKRECNISDFILDDLVADRDGSKKVRIGVSDESEGYTLIKCLDGFRVGGKFILKVVPIKKTTNPPGQNTFDGRPDFPSQGRNDYNAPRNDYPPRNDYQNQPNDYNRGPHGPGPSRSGGPGGPGGPLVPGRPLGPSGAGSHGPVDSGRPLPWANSNSTQWGHNPPVAAQIPQNTFGYQGQPTINPGFGQQHPNQHSDTRQYPQGNRPQEPGYGFPPKNVPDRPMRPMEARPQPVLRSIETMEPPGTQSRYPLPNRAFQQDKPVTILKDNFQGPTQFNIANPSGAGPAPHPWQHRQPSKPEPFSKPSPIGYEKPPFEEPSKYSRGIPKNPQMRPESYKEYEKPRGPSPDRPPRGRRPSPMDRRMSPPLVRGISPLGRRMSPPARRVSPPGRRISPPGRRVSPPGRRISPPGRRVSPLGRRVSPPGRRVSPPGRRISPPGRRISPSARRISPSSRRLSPIDTRMSPSGRRFSPDRRSSPSGRRISPHNRRFSPSSRRASPGQCGRLRAGGDRRLLKGRSGSPHLRSIADRRESPSRPATRYSPGRHHHPDKSMDKYHDLGKGSKQIRPAYEPSNQAPNQAMYSGGYRSGVHENAKYPGSRPIDHRPSPWQRDRDEYLKKDDERRMGERDARMPEKIVEAPLRKSRSPIRRDRSPIRDRFKRDSPSPRSPRRSWAFEKRRSPDIRDAPPPPSWPGQNPREDVHDERSGPNFRHGRPFSDKDPQRPSFPEKPEKHASTWDRQTQDDFRTRRLDQNKSPFDKRPERDLLHSGHGERYPPKFSPREDFNNDRHGGDYRRPNVPDSKPFNDLEDHRRLRDESPPREMRKEDIIKSHIDKDFEDIYNRTLQFKKKAEEMRRSAKRRGESEEQGTHSNRERTDRGFREVSPWKDIRRGVLRDDDDLRNPEKAETTRMRRLAMSPTVKVKRDKAITEICNKIIERNADYSQIKGEQRQRLMTELQLAVARIVFDMFGDKDVSFIEIVVKYQANHTAKDEERILKEVLSSLPRQFRTIKRSAPDPLEVPVKTAKRSSSPVVKETVVANASDVANWSVNVPPPQMVQMLSVQHMVTAMMNPAPVPPPFAQSYDDILQNQILEMCHDSDSSFNLYLCKDDFSTFTAQESQQLKDFLVAQLVKVSQTSRGWAPDITIKGLQSMHRYEIVANEIKSKEWLINLDFSSFQPYHMFNVLVYTKEELWYERAAIWLPGHSRMRNIEPLEKLKLQNKHLDGVNLGKWKFVKKIVTAKGTRLYVDMPPASARALEAHKMMLSYELQKVNVYLKAVAVDKDAFDAGMQEASITNPGELVTAVQQSPIPSLSYDTALVKITLKGAKTLTLSQTRKIKEVIIYQLFQYLQQDGARKTDFTKYGFFPPCYFGVVPENADSKSWLLSRQFGKLNRTPIVVIGGDDDNVHYLRMTATLPEYQTVIAIVTATFKQSNRGVKGINFSRWKPDKVYRKDGKCKFDVDVDFESVETMAKMNFTLDYVLSGHTYTVRFKTDHSKPKIEELIKKYRAETTDSYDIANMDLESSNSDSDILCLN